MRNYLLKRLFLLPCTLFAILLVNFVILNLAKGDPTEMLDASFSEGGRSQTMKKASFEDPYLIFREQFGLNLPILINLWPAIDESDLTKEIVSLIASKASLKGSERHAKELALSDRARFMMSALLHIAENDSLSIEARRFSLNLFARGGIRLGHLGPSLSKAEFKENQNIEKDNIFLLSLRCDEEITLPLFLEKLKNAKLWFEHVDKIYPYPMPLKQKVLVAITQTRFYRYFSKILHLDFGTLRMDANTKVTSEVAKRLKYSLTLAIIPLLVSFGLAQLFGLWMAIKQNSFIDHALNTFFLILFSIPVFVFAPFLIEKVALGHHLPFSDAPFPISSFHSENEIYDSLTSFERFKDIAAHLFLPLVSILYVMLAIQVKIARYAILEALSQDYVRTAKAKGLPMRLILFKHVGKNASITLVTSLASSLSTLLAGALIVETLFNINGFGRFFYDAILNRDYNVILFSTLMSSFLTLIGYFLADFAYMLLDPRIRIEARA